MTQFAKDSVHLKMHVLMDKGQHRCLRFYPSGHYGCGFTLTTWPGHLAITGDMGDAIFTRGVDMFEWLRGKSIEYPHDMSRAIVAGPSDNGREWDADAVVEAVQRYSDDGPRDMLLLFCGNEGEFKRQIKNVRYDYGDDSVSFSELAKWKYTSHHMWRLEAILWGISEYDKRRAMYDGPRYVFYMGNDETYELPVAVIIDHFNENKDDDEEFELDCDTNIIDWAHEDMSWRDVKEYVKVITEPLPSHFEAGWHDSTGTIYRNKPTTEDEK